MMWRPIPHLLEFWRYEKFISYLVLFLPWEILKFNYLEINYSCISSDKEFDYRQSKQQSKKLFFINSTSSLNASNWKIENYSNICYLHMSVCDIGYHISLHNNKSWILETFWIHYETLRNFIQKVQLIMRVNTIYTDFWTKMWDFNVLD